MPQGGPGDGTRPAPGTDPSAGPPERTAGCGLGDADPGLAGGGGVGPRAALALVRPGPAVERVVAVVPREEVVPSLAVELVGPEPVSMGAKLYLPPVSTTRSVTASRMSVRWTSSLGCRSASSAAIVRRLRGTPSASSARIAGATRATMASVSAEDG